MICARMYANRPQAQKNSSHQYQGHQQHTRAQAHHPHADTHAHINPVKHAHSAWKKAIVDGTIQAVLWDKDGTILDFNYMWVNWCRYIVKLAHQYYPGLDIEAIIKKWGIDLDSHHIDYDGLIAIGSGREIEKKLAESIFENSNIPSEEARTFARSAIEEANLAIESNHWIKAIPGVPEVITALSHQGISQAVVTTDNTEEADKHLNAVSLRENFEAVLGCDLVASCKPAPDLVYEACRMLQTKPAQAVVIGDTPSDMRMAKKAGAAYCIGVASGVTLEAHLQTDADVVLPSAGKLLDEDK